MRKLLVKRFALNYQIGKFAVMRSATILFPYFIGAGLILAFAAPTALVQLVLLAVLGLLLWISGLTPFSYFELYPVKWSELDDSQKWHYGNAAKSGASIKQDFSDIDWKEWDILNSKYSD